MLNDYFESFMLLEKHAEADGAGSERVAFSPVTAFRGGLTHSSGEEVAIGGRMTLKSTPMLLHDFDVTLMQGDYVRRERDGAIYRVTGCTADMRTPAFSGLAFGQVPVERLVIPC